MHGEMSENDARPIIDSLHACYLCSVSINSNGYIVHYYTADDVCELPAGYKPTSVPVNKWTAISALTHARSASQPIIHLITDSNPAVYQPPGLGYPIDPVTKQTDYPVNDPLTAR